MWKSVWKKMWKSLHPSWLFVAICAGVVFGMIFGVVFRVNFFSSIYWLIFFIILCIFAFLRPSYLFFIIIFLGGIVLGFFRTGKEVGEIESLREAVGENIVVSGTIYGDPNSDEGNISLRLRDLEVSDEKVSGTVFVQLSEDEVSVSRGDKIKIEGKFSEGFGSFTGAIYRPKILSISRPEPRDIFLELRDSFSEKVKMHLPEKEASLGLSYLLGMKNGLDKETLEILQIVGLTHIVVASGTHLGIIVSVVRKIFGKISRFAGLLFACLFIFVFGGMVGWTASILRATIVTVLSLFAWYVGRKFEGWRIIIITMAITLLINPAFIFDVGWLLSFSAFSGILILEPRLEKFFFRKQKVNKFLKILLVSVSAQIVCLPILIYYFGTVSLVSVVANVLILPTMPVVMGLTFLTGIFGNIEILGALIGKVTTILLDYHLAVMRFFAEQKMFIISFETKNLFIFLLYLVIFVPIIVSAIRRKIKAKRETRI